MSVELLLLVYRAKFPPTLSMGAISTLGRLADHFNKDEGCARPSGALLAEEIHATERAVRGFLRELRGLPKKASDQKKPGYLAGPRFITLLKKGRQHHCTEYGINIGVLQQFLILPTTIQSQTGTTFRSEASQGGTTFRSEAPDMNQVPSRHEPGSHHPIKNLIREEPVSRRTVPGDPVKLDQGFSQNQKSKTKTPKPPWEVFNEAAGGLARLASTPSPPSYSQQQQDADTRARMAASMRRSARGRPWR